MESEKNELKERVIALLENIPYSLVFFDYSSGAFGNAVIIVKRNDNEYFLKVVCDRCDIFIYYLEKEKSRKFKAVENITKNKRLKLFDKWKYIDYYHVEEVPNRYDLFLKVLEEYAK